jgi:glycosyltransferase involved in cell wall biosynthesis
VFGVPVYNQARHVGEALESILGQTHRDLGVVVIDDASVDETAAVAAGYAARDPRLVLRRNATRLGYIDNARQTFDVGQEVFSGAEYFAWGSDHDVWHPRWVEALVREMDRHPQVVLAYPRALRIDLSGETLSTHNWRFETMGVADPLRRLDLACRNMWAGNMVYGLMRASALREAGVLRHHLLPDRLLIAELALLGQFRHGHEFLWWRRRTGEPSIERQIAASFLGPRPWHLSIPWWLAHALSLYRNVRTQPGGLTVGFAYLRATLTTRVRSIAWRRTVQLRDLAAGARRRLLELGRHG